MDALDTLQALCVTLFKLYRGQLIVESGGE